MSAARQTALPRAFQARSPVVEAAATASSQIGEIASLAAHGCAVRHHRGMWIDTHCHLDAPEFDADRAAVAARARAAGVSRIVVPAVAVEHFERVRRLAHEQGLAYALGIHPLCVAAAHDDDLDRLQQALTQHAADARLVAVGEIGLDHFVPGLDRVRQAHFYTTQLRLARDAGLPVILHVRRSADDLLKGLRCIEVIGGIAHAFNGSRQQAAQFLGLDFCLGFGGAMTFDRALQIRALAATLPESALVLETDAPDIPPHWLYRTAADRVHAPGQGRNEPAELPRIGAVLATLRGCTPHEAAAFTAANAARVLPRLKALA